MKEEILDKSDNLDSLKNNKSLIKTKISSIIASLTFIGLITYIILLIFNNRNIMNFSSNSSIKLLKEENDYSFVTEYTTEEDDKTIEIINPNFKNIISKLEIDGEEVEACTSYTFKSKGIHKIYFTFNLDGVTSFERMFSGNDYLTTISFSPSFNTENITNMEGWFNACNKLISVDLSHLNFRNVIFLGLSFGKSKSLKTVDLSNINAEKLTDMAGTFYGSSSLTFINLTNFNAPELWQMIHTFRECTSLISIDFTNFRAPKLITLQNAFYMSPSLKSVNLSSVESDAFRILGEAFSGCSSLEYVYLPKTTIKKDVIVWRAFRYCQSLKSIDLSDYTGKELSYQTFEGCTNLTYIDISSYDDIPENLFSNLPEIGEIKVNKRGYDNIKDQIPEDWTIIVVK